MGALKAFRRILGNAIYPRRAEFLAMPDKVIDSLIVGTYAPDEPVIPADAAVACIGSCFAEEFGKRLSTQGKSVIPLWLSERWATSFAVRHFVDYGLAGIEPPPGFLSNDTPLARAMLESKSLQNADAFIITLGLSLCWHEIESDRMVLDIKAGHAEEGITQAIMTHMMRQSSVDDNISQILAVIARIRTVKPTAPIIFTLSPIPLFMSMTDYSVIPSNLISKSTLRIALHNLTERHIEGVYYWPSYEMVDWLGKHHGPIWGHGGDDLRHIKTSIVDDIVSRFSKMFFKPVA